MRIHRITTLAGLSCLAAAAPVRAQLWDTGAWDGLDGRASDHPSTSIRPETRAADDFVLIVGNGQPYTISGLSARALAQNYTGAFAEIYADASGIPAATPSFTLTSTNVQVLQTGVFGQYDLINVTLNTAGLSLPAGRWWVSLVCNVSGAAPPNDGYGFFATGGNMVVQGSQGYYRVDSGPWTPLATALGYPSDLSFTLQGQQQPPPPPPCYPNCDGSTVQPILNTNDFICFLNKFSAGDSYANCDGSTVAPVLNTNDFICFLNRFSAGCS